MFFFFKKKMLLLAKNDAPSEIEIAPKIDNIEIILRSAFGIKTVIWPASIAQCIDALMHFSDSKYEYTEPCGLGARISCRRFAGGIRST